MAILICNDLNSNLILQVVYNIRNKLSIATIDGHKDGFKYKSYRKIHKLTLG